MKRVKINMALYAIVWSLVIGMMTAGYLNLVNWVINLVWRSLFHISGVSSLWYPFVVCIPLGFLIGYLNRQLGDYPLTIVEVLNNVHTKGRLDYHHWWKSFILGLLALGAGETLALKLRPRCVTIRTMA